jgi:hypothetical protein
LEPAKSSQSGLDQLLFRVRFPKSHRLPGRGQSVSSIKSEVQETKTTVENLREMIRSNIIGEQPIFRAFMPAGVSEEWDSPSEKRRA